MMSGPCPRIEGIVLQGHEDRLKRFRSLKVFFDICVRCGACADKCHFFLGTGDPKNMPVLRAELLRSVYRRYFKKIGQVLGEIAGARDLTEDVIKEWFFYLTSAPSAGGVRCSALTASTWRR
jgi:ferredoxin